jgi:DNA-binding PadR family transcriptional regulator
MARTADALSRIDVLILSSLERLPMHGYELKLELSYKHVGWWAKFEHGHLYAALKRLEKKKFIRGAARARRGRERRVFAITPRGQRWLEDALAGLATMRDTTYFDIDLFISATFTLPRERVLTLLAERVATLGEQTREAEALEQRMRGLVPTAAQLIMAHRIQHLSEEARFARQAADTLAKQKEWKPFLGNESISDFLKRTRAPILEATEPRASTRGRPKKARAPRRGTG